MFYFNSINIIAFSLTQLYNLSISPPKHRNFQQQTKEFSNFKRLGLSVIVNDKYK